MASFSDPGIITPATLEAHSALYPHDGLLFPVRVRLQALGAACSCVEGGQRGGGPCILAAPWVHAAPDMLCVSARIACAGVLHLWSCQACTLQALQSGEGLRGAVRPLLHLAQQRRGTVQHALVPRIPCDNVPAVCLR
jgi:hypothetical protein